MATATDERETVEQPESLAARYESVRARLRAAAVRSGRRAEDVLLVAVTKTASIDQIRELVKLGQVDLGESRVQMLAQHAAQVEEFLHRCRVLARPGGAKVPREVRWHMIGHLQRNKVRKVQPLVRLIHSIDSLRLAEEVQAVAAKLEAPVDVLIQVNVSGERQKHGVAPAATRHLIEQIETMFNVRVRGLMCMAPFGDDPEVARPVFERCHELFEDIRREGVAGDRFDILSMGMTGDFEVAIECGANMVRVGTAIFGAGDDATRPSDPEIS
jgi:hypothetical protein